MEFVKLNENWNAEPNAPKEKIEIMDNNLILSFYLNSFQFKQFNDKDIGILNFYNCYQYRYGVPNDEGFFIYGQSRYKQYGVEWGEFYLVKNSDWKINFPNPIFIDTALDTNKLNHYLFYFKDYTFECIAKSFEFIVEKFKV